MQELLDFDKKHIWHPYTSLTNPLPVYPVKSAKGVHIILEDGIRLIDGMGSWWCKIHGYNHPKLNEAILEQIQQVSHVMFGGLTHEPAIKISQKLVELTPKGLDKVFLCDSGSVSVEVAMKMAFQYWFSLGNTQKSKMMTIRKGYHGDTFRAMSVCDPVGGMHHFFQSVLPKHIFVDEPSTPFGEKLNESDNQNLETAFAEHHQEIAAFILEPIVQGAGGMRMYSADFLKKVRTLCDKYDVLLIADEIATGFGRTGEFFACNHAQIAPDILCLGKALTGGMMTMAATLCTTKIAETISNGPVGVFAHGPTFMANPLSSRVALASIDLLLSQDWKSIILNIENILKENLQTLSNHKLVKEVRVLGAIGVVECYKKINVAAIQKFFVQSGVWIRPFRNLIYIMPPYIIQEAELLHLCKTIKEGLKRKEHFN